MSRKKWEVKKYDKEKVTAIAEALNISPYAALIASTRGIADVDSARSFFGFEVSDTVDPMAFPDMNKAVKRIHQALDEFERIAVYGDYDADGVTATTLLYSYLEMQGADVVYYVPDRHTQGYGLSFSAVDDICRMGAKLIVTVDNGISAVDEAKYINELEMELIITDHHLPSETLPEAVAVVDPHIDGCNLEFKDYAGVGVAYKLICALEGGEDDVTQSFTELVALGTVADVMPLKGENREIVRRGIEELNNSERVGIQALREAAGLEDKYINSVSAAFGLIPRINAAGRMGSAARAIKLLLSDDLDEAEELANEINDDNTERQKIEQDILAQALEQIKADKNMQYDPVIVVDGDNWHDGVIGIVASRLVERFGRPTIVITRIDGTAKGSGRSIDGFNLYNALCACSDVLTHFGGHTLAAGLGVEPERICEFREKINEYADNTELPFPVQRIDFKINPAYVNSEILNVIDLLEPFGTENPTPIFGLYNMKITDIQPIGDGKHLRLVVNRDAVTLTALKFRTTQLDFPFCVGDVVDIAASFDKNEYLGQVRLSIIIKNIKFHNTDEELLFKRMREFSSVMRGRSKSITTGDVLPDRNVIADVYKFIRNYKKWRYDNETLCCRMGKTADDYAKVAVAVEALVQLGTLVYDGDGNLTLPQENSKVNLDDAPILIRIKSYEK
jgi:single-stranded-DNA-specific exonuclease